MPAEPTVNLLLTPCSKKYQIERMDGEKVISRSRGFTVDSCVSAVLASQETPEFNGLPTGEKVSAARHACQQHC